jgi:hypothetical protein
MPKKFLSLLLALVTLLAAAPVRAQAAEELTAEEEREARELARQFAERTRETNDVGPPVAALFVADFAERLRHERDRMPMNFVEPEVSRRATDEELRGFYVAQFNFFSLTLAYWMTTADMGESDDGDDGWNLEKMYPPEVAGVLRSDPTIAGFVAKHEANEALKASGAPAPEGEQEEEVDERFVKDLSTLHTVTATGSKAAEALRPYVPPYSSIRRAQEEKEEAPPDEFEEVHTPHLESEGCGEFGLPDGTRVIQIQVEPARDMQFSLLMVRADGRLRILYAFPVFGD